MFYNYFISFQLHQSLSQYQRIKQLQQERTLNFIARLWEYQSRRSHGLEII